MVYTSQLEFLKLKGWDYCLKEALGITTDSMEMPLPANTVYHALASHKGCRQWQIQRFLVIKAVMARPDEKGLKG